MSCKLDVIYRVCGNAPVDARRILKLANVESIDSIQEERLFKEPLTSRYINIERLVLTEFDHAVPALVEIARQCRKKYAPLFNDKEIGVHELYCALFHENQTAASLILLTRKDMQELCKLGIEIALNIYQAD